MTEYEDEKALTLAEEALSPGEYMSSAVSQYARTYGADRPDAAWILSPFDTWERNPHYSGAPQAHPEDHEEISND